VPKKSRGQGVRRELDTFSVHDDKWSTGSYDVPGTPDAPDAEAMSPVTNFSSYHLPIIGITQQCDSALKQI